MVPFPKEDELAIVSECKKHGRSRGSITCEFGQKKYIVKYDLSRALSLNAHVANQRYLDSVARNADGIRIAGMVVHEFKHQAEGEKEKAYIVMPFISLLGTAPSDKDVKIEKAVRWLATVVPPDGHKLGPLGGGAIVNRLFKDDEAPLVFTDVGALQLYMEKVCGPTYSSRIHHHHPSRLSEAWLVSYIDLYLDNRAARVFLITKRRQHPSSSQTNRSSAYRVTCTMTTSASTWRAIRS